MEETQGQVETAEGLPILLGVRVVVDVEGIGERLESRLVGSDYKSFLLITTPESDSSEKIRDQYYLGRGIVGRYLASGKVHGFRSRVRQSLSKPARLLFLSYPASIEKVDLRSSRRFAALCWAALQAGSEKHQGVLLDVSQGGCCFRGRIPEASALDDSPVTLRLSFPGSSKALSLPGRTRACRKSSAEMLEVGISFADLPPEAKNQLDDYLDVLQEML